MKRIISWLTGSTALSILLAFVIGGFFIRIAGFDPFAGYRAMVEGSLLSPLGISNTIVRAIPLIGMAMATAIAFRAGILNLGTEGQMVLGGLSGALVALYVPGPAFLVVPLALVAAFVTGAAWALVAAGLQFWPGVPILITSLLLSYPARYFVSWLVRFPLKDENSSTVATEPITPDHQVPLIVDPSSGLGTWLTDTFGPRSLGAILSASVNWSLVIVLLIVVAMIFVNKRTAFGYESGIHGLNARFAKYGGVNNRAVVVKTMSISGGVAGLTGAMFTIGAPNTRLIEGAIISTNYAWTGLLVALLALYRPLGVLLGGVFFGAIMAGSGAMSRELGLSPQIASVIQGIVIILLAFQVTWPHLRRRRTPTGVLPASGVTEGEPVVTRPIAEKES